MYRVMSNWITSIVLTTYVACTDSSTLLFLEIENYPSYYQLYQKLSETLITR